MIIGLYADEAHRLKSDVWVNDWEIDGDGRAEFYGDCRVEDLDVSDSDYGLEPVDEEGNAIALENALNLPVE